MGSLMLDPNQMTSNIAVAFLFLIYLRSQKLVRLFYFLFCFLTLILGAILASSFSGIIAIVISVLIYYIFLGKALPIFRIVLFSGLFTIVFLNLIGLPEVFQERFLGKIGAGSFDDLGSLGARITLMNKAWELIENNPFIGIGIDNFSNYTGLNNTVHNAFLLSWVEGGIFSIMGIMLLILSFPIFFFQSKRLKTLIKKPIYSLSMSFSVLFAINLASHTHFYGRYWFVPVFLIITLLKLELKKYEKG